MSDQVLDRAALNQRLFGAVMAAYALVYAFHFWVVWSTAVDVPSHDEWSLLCSDGLPAANSLEWFFRFHAEHRIVTTKLLIWMLYQVNGWDLVVHAVVNFLLYGMLLLLMFTTCRRISPETPAWVVLAFLFFLLSPINYENHYRPFQSQFHFALIFVLIGVRCLFDERQRAWMLLTGAAALIVAAYSLAAGLLAAFAALVAFSAHKYARAHSAGSRRTDARQWLLVVSLSAMPLAAWFLGYSPHPAHPPISWPWKAEFWGCFLDLFSLGLGVDTPSLFSGIALAAVLVAPWLIVAWRGRQTDPRTATLVSLALASVAIFAAVAMGRAGFGPGQAKSSRYSELAMFGMIWAVLGWAKALEHDPRLRSRVLVALWLVCFFGFADNWDFGVYGVQQRARLRDVAAIRAQCLNPNACPNPEYREMLENARRLNLSFYRRCEKQN
jgi:hypothetical protein